MTRHGSCHCGGVAFHLTGAAEPVAVCHCRQCRVWSGHLWASTGVPGEGFHLVRSASLRWFRSSAHARRGFCAICGASLFWQADAEGGRICVAAGALDRPTGLSVEREIFTGSGPDTAASLTTECLCGAVHIGAPGPAGPVTACHCCQCRKISGHFAASFDAPEAQTRVSGPVAEYRTQGGSQRGFCPTCGSSLYFRAADGSFSIEAGGFGGQITAHVFTADKGDYYRLPHDIPQYPGPGPDH